jgi:D-cysteine desulfhydrase family pyridoxal phosphate-dependent enzyme
LGLTNASTPLEELAGLSAYLGGPRIFIKRDDCTTIGGGGNKIRKLDFLVADAIARKADTLITIGGVQSNHCRQTAAVAARFGLKCRVLLTAGAHADRPSYARTGNVLLSRLFGARIDFLPEGADKAGALEAAAAAVEAEGGRPYPIVAGGSTPIGCLGYVAAARELVDQLTSRGVSPAAIIHSSGSGGTQAGLMVGLAMSGHAVPVIGMSCGKPAPALAVIVSELGRSVAGMLGVAPGAIGEPIIDDGQIGPGYALPNAATLEAIELCARHDGILVDPVYTGKAMAGLIDLVRRGRFGKKDAVVFLHTGGAPALFAYEEEFN